MKSFLFAILVVITSNAIKADTLDDIRQAIITKINEFRATKGLSSLARWVDGEACANLSAEEDRKIFSQTQTPHASKESREICNAGASAYGQNTLRDYSLQGAYLQGLFTLQEAINKGLERMWAESKTNGIHYQNMNSEKFKQVAVGIYVNPEDNRSRDKYWINMNFRD